MFFFFGRSGRPFFDDEEDQTRFFGSSNDGMNPIFQDCSSLKIFPIDFVFLAYKKKREQAIKRTASLLWCVDIKGKTTTTMTPAEARGGETRRWWNGVATPALQTFRAVDSAASIQSGRRIRLSNGKSIRGPGIISLALSLLFIFPFFFCCSFCRKENQTKKKTGKGKRTGSVKINDQSMKLIARLIR